MSIIHSLPCCSCLKYTGTGLLLFQVQGQGRWQAACGPIVQFQWENSQPVAMVLSNTVIVAWDPCIIDAVGQKSRHWILKTRGTAVEEKQQRI